MDLQEISNKMQRHNEQRKQFILNKWNRILEKVTNSVQRSNKISLIFNVYI